MSSKANGTMRKRREGKKLKSVDTMETLDEHIESIGNHREHLKEDNAYEETPVPGSPASEASVPVSSSSSSGTSTATTTSATSTTTTTKKRGKDVRRFRFRNLSHRFQESLLDEMRPESTFFGFYTLFWLTLAVVIVRSAVYNYVEFRALFGSNIAQILITDIVPIGLTDLLMYITTYVTVVIQLAIKRGFISWNRTGWVLQTLWQTWFLFSYMLFADRMKFPWIGQVFLLLHSLVLIMKQHSFAYYNGYLWSITKELDEKQDLLKRLKKRGYEDESNLEKINADIAFCKEELRAQSSSTPFPKNVTASNYFQYSMFPTLVYQIDYPRTDRIRWKYVLEKIAAVFGVFFLMIVVAENYLYPSAIKALALRDVPFSQKCALYPYIFLDLVIPFLVMYLLVFYIIWDAILNAIAELTRFADREFYGPWWNSVTWDQFARDWNTPVHRFLLRHVYHSSMSALHVSKGSATVLTFLLSSCVHELVMLCIFKKLRGYLLFLQMCQLPLVAISRTRYFRDKRTLGNVVFWFGIITGPSLMCSMYLTF